jgi:hypothetical protein
MKRLFGLIGAVLLFFLIATLFVATPASAAPLDDVTDILSDHTPGGTPTHSVAYTTASAIPKNGKIIITFPTGFDGFSKAQSS